MKDLPKIYKNKINNSNNRNSFYSDKKEIKEDDIKVIDNRNIDEKLTSLFKNNRLGFTKEVTIITKDKRIVTRLVSRGNTYLLTLDNDQIKISDIIDIITN